MKEYVANLIVKTMISQVDDERFSSLLMDGIIDYKKDPSVAMSIEDKYLVTRRGQKRIRKTTQGWKLLVTWRDKTEA